MICWKSKMQHSWVAACCRVCSICYFFMTVSQLFFSTLVASFVLFSFLPWVHSLRLCLVFLRFKALSHSFSDI